MSSGPYYGIVLDVRYTAYGGGGLLSRVLIFFRRDWQSRRRESTLHRYIDPLVGAS